MINRHGHDTTLRDHERGGGEVGRGRLRGTMETSAHGGWRIAQSVVLAGAVGVVLLLFVQPQFGLWLTWDLLIPMVPAVLLFVPQVWRNVCPIASVNQLPVLLGRSAARKPGHFVQRSAPAIAGLLLLAIVPLRLVLFNESGVALGLFVLTVLGVALAGGWFMSGKAGWCGTFCPLLPVERLYGQAPLIRIRHAHCAACSGCVRACYDLGPAASLGRLTGTRHARHGMAGLHRSPMGVFAAAFPGFVAGYFSAPVSPGLLQAYGWVAGGAALSAILFMAAQRLAHLSSMSLTRLSAAAAIGIYYWFTAAAVAEAAHEMLSLPPPPVSGIAAARAAAIAAAGIWLIVAARRARVNGRLVQSGPTAPAG